MRYVPAKSQSLDSNAGSTTASGSNGISRASECFVSLTKTKGNPKIEK